ncbi:hypothetical protein B0H10DRAFT_2041508 [Mycena sp. CBHHK59/15]|nr:hypothetical protein B0H10DRAFT_2041508 [Mycena sp. CBHHK59/15]
MTPFAREHIKHAHHGRETCGVLAESTSHTIGASMCSIIFHFLNCFLLFFSPVLAGVLAFIVASHRAMTASVLILACHTLSEVDPALVASIYVYWTAFCIYLLYLARPHSLNIVKYQTFFTPWRYRRDHVSHMRLDCLRRACQPPPALGDVSKPDSPNLIPVFIDIATAGTIALAVTPSTTVQDICEAVCERGPIYLMGLWRLLRAGETMSALGICGLRHFIMPPRLRGGAGGSMSVHADGTVVNEHGWEQGALNPDGSSKSAEVIDFGGDPRTPPRGCRRPKRGKDKVFQATKRKVQSHAQRSAKGKEKETPSDAEDSMYSCSGSDDDPNYIACLNVSYLSYPPTWSQVGFLL